MKTPIVALLAVALGAQSAVRLFAQDVIVGEPVWAMAEAAPDELPQSRGRLRPDFPEEMKKASEYGYAIISRYVDATGKSLSLNAAGTHVPFQRSVQEAFQGWTMSAAKRGGQAVDAQIWMGVIFNPKSAAAKGAEAAPRLLAVTPVFTTERPAPAGQPPIVRVKLNIDATGAVTNVQPQGELQPKLAESVALAVKSWRFAPARQGGQPVEAEISLPVLCQPPLKVNAAKMVPPRRKSGDEPEYPVAMRRFGLEGKVLIDFEVDADGKVVNPVIFESDSPAFDEPALKALLTWKFQPATTDGKPVKSKMRVPVMFQLNSGGEQGIVRIDREPDQSKLPLALRYDTPPKFRGVMLPVYPLGSREAGLRGKAVVGILINPLGRVSQVKVLSADHPEFGLALTAAVEGFRFDPAYRDGKPVQHLLRFEQEFNSTILGGDEDGLLALEKRSPERIVGADKLDATPTPLSRREPVFPVQAPAGVTGGSATIEFLIDREGRARLPRIVTASDPAFGYAGVQAVGTWLFTPPLSGGKKVVTRVQVPLIFAPRTPSKPAAEEAK